MKTLSCLSFHGFLFAAVLHGQTSSPVPLDDFSSPESWKIIRSDGVHCTIHPAEGPDAAGANPCIRLDYQFTKGAGYCIIQRPISLTLPDAESGTGFEFSFDIRGFGPPNNLELKLLDTGGDPHADAEKSDVWWVNRRAFEWPESWMTVRNKRRHFTFAWGPSGGGGGGPKHVDKIEFAVACGMNGGGSGSIWIDNLAFREVPPVPTPAPQPKVSASSTAKNADPPAALFNGSSLRGWGPSGDDPNATLDVDFGYERDLGGVEVFWARHVLTEYSILLSVDGRRWEKVRESRRDAHPERHIHPLPDATARYLRFAFHRVGEDKTTAPWINRIIVHEPEFSLSLNGMMSIITGDSPRYPRYFRGTTNYWTVVGLPGAFHESLIDQFGIIEPRSGGCSIDPVIRIDGGMLTWASSRHEHNLAGGSLPIPTVHRTCAGLSLDITAVADGTADSPNLIIEYAITNNRDAAASGTLDLLLRPFQVLPPSQGLNITGGVTQIHSISRSGCDLTVNRSTTFRFPEGASFAASWFARGDIADLLDSHAMPIELPSGSEWLDPDGLASAAASVPFTLAPGETRRWHVEVPGTDPKHSPSGSALNSSSDRIAACVAGWDALLSRASVSLPKNIPLARHVEDTIRSTLAYILINADGPAIQPGSRNYKRSWIRDGALTSAALLSFGHEDLAVAFIDWYANSVDLDGPAAGKVPCVVDHRGPDPVPEHDSHGEYIFAVMNAYRHTRERALLVRHWPRIRAVVAHIDSLRARRLTPEFSRTGPERIESGKPPVPALAFRGVMPESISHEGYSAKPMHSYWDNWWTLRGLRDAAEIALILGEHESSDRFTALAREFEDDLSRSISLARTAHGIGYMPGCVELGDFDSTSTTIAVWPCAPDDFDSIAGGCIAPTFERYWSFFTDRAAGNNWDAFTPYELRHVGTFVRLGQRDRALKSLEWFFRFQRPAGWNHWAEVVFNDEDTPKFIGDMPHTWCGSDFLNSVRAMLIHERSGRAGEHQKLLELFRGIPEEWIDTTPGVSFRDLRTIFGRLSASASRVGSSVRIEISGLIDPDAAVIVRNPRGAAPARVLANGAAISLYHEAAVITTLPCHLEFEYEN